MTHSPTNHASIPTHPEERHPRCLSSHLGLTLTLLHPISWRGNALGVLKPQCQRFGIWAAIIPPISWWSPRQHWPLPAHLLHDVTTTVVMMQQCIVRVRHDNVCVRLIFKHHLQSCSHQWMSTQSDHYALLHPLLLEVCWILALEAQFQSHFGPQNRS